MSTDSQSMQYLRDQTHEALDNFLQQFADYAQLTDDQSLRDFLLYAAKGIRDCVTAIEFTYGRDIDIPSISDGPWAVATQDFLAQEENRCFVDDLDLHDALILAVYRRINDPAFADKTPEWCLNDAKAETLTTASTCAETAVKH